jgi:hypothetical protein
MSDDEYDSREADAARKVIPFPSYQRATPQSTVEALMLGLRERGVQALKVPAVKQRLSELSDDQIIEVGNRLQRLKPEIARAWTADEVKQLLRSR